MLKNPRWLLVVFFIVLIAYFSRQPYSQQDISPLLEKQEHIIASMEKMPPIEISYHHKTINSHQTPVDFLQFVMRKIAHLTLYGLLGLSILYALAAVRKIGFEAWITSGLIVLGIATLDEINQFTMSTRTGCPDDVLLDLTGYILFTAIALLIYKAIDK